MLIKDSGDLESTLRSVRNLLSKRKLIAGMLALVAYTALVMVVASFMVKHGVWGSYVKPWAGKNIRGVMDYVASWSAKPESIVLDIKQKDILKLAHKREEAINSGVLLYSSDDWVPARLTHQNKTFKVKVRLKGTRGTHWVHENYWSYKIKISGNDSFLGMRRFAIQGPHNRNYLNEWIFQKLYQHVGVISLRYDFIKVTINGREFPVYALEENFDVKLVENNQRREGPVFRARLSPPFSSQAIDIYGSGKYKKDKNLIHQVYSAENLIKAYRQGELPASKVFDVDVMAKVLALCDLAGSFHTLSYENMRFYYNPVTGKIEPVPYDNQHITDLNESQMIGEGHWISQEDSRKLAAHHAIRWPQKNLIWVYQLFQDPIFYKKYTQALEAFAQEEFLDEFNRSIEEEKQEKIKILHTSWPQYQFGGDEILYKNLGYIRERLQPKKSVTAHLNRSDQNTVYLDVANIHSLAVEVDGLVMQDGTKFAALEKVALPAKRLRGGPWVDGTTDLKVYYEGFVAPLPDRDEIKFQTIGFQIPPGVQWSNEMLTGMKVQSHVLGLTHSIEDSVIPWTRKEDIMRQPSNIDAFSFLVRDENNKTIQIKSGQWRVEKDMIIPPHYRLKAGPGTRILLDNQSKLLSFSPLDFEGAPGDPVHISAQPGSGQGVLVLAGGEESNLQHVVFSGLSNPRLGGWGVSGAVTFYESPVRMNHVRFEGNHSEDALNIVRSEFEMDYVVFQDIFSDAFDSDFSSGKIKNIVVRNSGNDGVDVSGSQVTIEDMTAEEIGDKGVSAGENSQVKIKNFTGRNGNILLASKDLSRLHVENAILKDSKYGVAAYQKKSEFGPGTIEIDSIKIANLQIPYLVEKGSRVKVEGKSIKDDSENIRKVLYPGKN